LLRDRLPVHLDPVTRLDERVQLPRLPVDADAAGLDQLVGLAARRDARTCQVRVQPHSGTCWHAAAAKRPPSGTLRVRNPRKRSPNLRGQVVCRRPWTAPTTST